MSKVKAIIFDLDGVIIDSENLWTDADLSFLKNEGITVDKEHYKKTVKTLLMGIAFTEGIDVFKKHLGLEGEIEELLNKRKSMINKYLENVAYVNGFTQFHNKLKESYKTAIATALVRYFLDPIIVKFELKRLFNDHIYSIEDIGFIPKPNPDIYLHAAAKLGFKPQECIGIEDSPKGVEAVNRAGMKSIAITTTYDKEMLSHADLIVDSFSEIDLSKNLIIPIP